MKKWWNTFNYKQNIDLELYENEFDDNQKKMKNILQ